jgi:hypothetical protein
MPGSETELKIIQLSDCHDWYVYKSTVDDKPHCYSCKKICTYHKGLEPHA